MRPKKLQSNWSRGISKERRIARKLRSEGYFVVRSAGSQGAADLIAIHPGKKIIRVIQCKSFIPSEREKQLFLEPLKALEGQYILISELI